MKNFYKLLIKKRYNTLSGAISFFVLLNGWSVAFLILLVSRSINIDINIFNNLPNDVLVILRYYKNIVDNSLGSISVFLVLSSLYGSSSLFYHLIKTGEIIYDIKRKREKILNRVFSIILTICFVFLILLIIIVKIILSIISKGLINRLIENLITIIMAFIVLVFINYYITPIKIKLKNTIIGSIFTDLFWHLGTYLFIFFIKITNYGNFYQNMAILIITQLFIYIMSIGFVIGVIINYLMYKSSLSDNNIIVHKE